MRQSESGVMADARVLEEEIENATEELTDSLLSINGKNQFKWNGSAELLESFLYKKLGLSADDVTTSSNGTCTVWKKLLCTALHTFKHYATNLLSNQLWKILKLKYY